MYRNHINSSIHFLFIAYLQKCFRIRIRWLWFASLKYFSQFVRQLLCLSLSMCVRVPKKKHTTENHYGNDPHYICNTEKPHKLFIQLNMDDNGAFTTSTYLFLSRVEIGHIFAFPNLFVLWQINYINRRV